MVKWTSIGPSLFILGWILGANHPVSPAAPNQVSDGPVHHVVVVWLKDAGSERARKRYIEASRRLGSLPGVLNYRIGQMLPGKAETSAGVADSSFDLAVTSTFEDARALSRYLQSAEHRRIIDEELRPLVQKCIVYDFGGER